jgi:hypothetical protein
MMELPFIKKHVLNVLLDEWKKIIHNENECFHSSLCLLLGLLIEHSFGG